MKTHSLDRPATIIALSRTAQAQSEAAIRHSLRLLRVPVYPGDFTFPVLATAAPPGAAVEEHRE